MLGQVKHYQQQMSEGLEIVKLDDKNAIPAILQFSELLYKNPEKCPDKFQFRVDENYLSMLDVGQVAQFCAMMIDLEIMSSVNFKMELFRQFLN